jgi:hypothetical protein
MTSTLTVSGNSDPKKKIIVWYDRVFDYSIDFDDPAPFRTPPPAEIRVKPQGAVKIDVVQNEKSDKTNAYMCFSKIRATLVNSDGVDASSIAPPPMVVDVAFKWKLTSHPKCSVEGEQTATMNWSLGAVTGTEWKKVSAKVWEAPTTFDLDTKVFAPGRIITAKLSEKDFMSESVQKDILDRTYWALDGNPTVVSAYSSRGSTTYNIDLKTEDIRLVDTGVLPKWYPALRVTLDAEAKDVTWWETWKDRLANCMTCGFKLDKNAKFAHDSLKNFPSMRDGLEPGSRALDIMFGVANFSLNLARAWGLDALVNQQVASIGAPLNSSIVERKAKAGDVVTELRGAKDAHTAERASFTEKTNADDTLRLRANEAFALQQEVARLERMTPPPANLGERQYAAMQAELGRAEAQQAAEAAGRDYDAKKQVLDAKKTALGRAISDFERKKNEVRSNLKVGGGVAPTAEGVLADVNLSWSPFFPPIPLFGLPVFGQVDAKPTLSITAKCMVGINFRHAVVDFLGETIPSYLGMAVPTPQSEKWQIGIDDKSTGFSFGVAGGISAGASTLGLRVALGGEIGLTFKATFDNITRIGITAACSFYASGELGFWYAKLTVRMDLIKIVAPSGAVDLRRLADGFDFTGGWQVYVIGKQVV